MKSVVHKETLSTNNNVNSRINLELDRHESAEIRNGKSTKNEVAIFG